MLFEYNINNIRTAKLNISFTSSHKYDYLVCITPVEEKRSYANTNFAFIITNEFNLLTFQDH